MEQDSDLLPYEEVTDPSYAQMASDNFTVEYVQPGVTILRGTCPRCGAAMDVPLVDTVFGGMRSIRDVIGMRRRHKPSKPGEHIEPVICACEHEHPNRPEGYSGCGAYWTLLLTTESK